MVLWVLCELSHLIHMPPWKQALSPASYRRGRGPPVHRRVVLLLTSRVCSLYPAEGRFLGTRLRSGVRGQRVEGGGWLSVDPIHCSPATAPASSTLKMPCVLTRLVMAASRWALSWRASC